MTVEKLWEWREKREGGEVAMTVCVCELTVRMVRSVINMEHRFPSHTHWHSLEYNKA